MWVHCDDGCVGGMFFVSGLLRVLMVEKTGASLVYTPEQGMDLDLLRKDVKFLKLRYGLDVKGKSEGRLVIRYVPFTLSPPETQLGTATNARRRCTRRMSSPRCLKRKVARCLTRVWPPSDILCKEACRPRWTARVRRASRSAACPFWKSTTRSCKHKLDGSRSRPRRVRR